MIIRISNDRSKFARDAESPPDPPRPARALRPAPAEVVLTRRPRVRRAWLRPDLGAGADRGDRPRGRRPLPLLPSKEQLLRAICDQLMDPLLDAGRGAARRAARAGRAAARARAPVGRHVVAHRDHMLVFQQERHVIERGAAWRGVRASRKAFERLAEDALEAVRARADPRDWRSVRACSGWSTTRRSGTARAAAWRRTRSPTATSTSF